MNSKSNSTDGTEESLESSSFVPLRRPRRPAPSPPVIQPIDTLETDRIRSYDSMQTVRTVDTIDTSDTNPDVLDELEELRDGSESGHDTYTARRSCLGLVIQTLCRQINYYDDERDVHLDFLTATQLQRLVSSIFFCFQFEKLIFFSFFSFTNKTRTDRYSQKSISSNASGIGFCFHQLVVRLEHSGVRLNKCKSIKFERVQFFRMRCKFN